MRADGTPRHVLSARDGDRPRRVRGQADAARRMRGASTRHTRRLNLALTTACYDSIMVTACLPWQRSERAENSSTQ